MVDECLHGIDFDTIMFTLCILKHGKHIVCFVPKMNCII